MAVGLAKPDEAAQASEFDSGQRLVQTLRIETAVVELDRLRDDMRRVEAAVRFAQTNLGIPVLRVGVVVPLGHRGVARQGVLCRHVEHDMVRAIDHFWACQLHDGDWIVAPPGSEDELVHAKLRVLLEDGRNLGGAGGHDDRVRSGAVDLRELRKNVSDGLIDVVLAHDLATLFFNGPAEGCSCAAPPVVIDAQNGNALHPELIDQVGFHRLGFHGAGRTDAMHPIEARGPGRRDLVRAGGFDDQRYPVSRHDGHDRQSRGAAPRAHDDRHLLTRDQILGRVR